MVDKVAQNGNNTENGGRGVDRQSRRRLLKAGAFAVPVVITVKSSAAWAASLSCTDKMTNMGAPIVPGPFDDGSKDSTNYDPNNYNTDPKVPFDKTKGTHQDYLLFAHANNLPGGSCYGSIITTP
jgi:hypothetical protein